MSRKCAASFHSCSRTELLDHTETPNDLRMQYEVSCVRAHPVLQQCVLRHRDNGYAIHTYDWHHISGTRLFISHAGAFHMNIYMVYAVGTHIKLPQIVNTPSYQLFRPRYLGADCLRFLPAFFIRRLGLHHHGWFGNKQFD